MYKPRKHPPAPWVYRDGSSPHEIVARSEAGTALGARRDPCAGFVREYGIRHERGPIAEPEHAALPRDLESKPSAMPIGETVPILCMQHIGPDKSCANLATLEGALCRDNFPVVLVGLEVLAGHAREACTEWVVTRVEEVLVQHVEAIPIVGNHWPTDSRGRAGIGYPGRPSLLVESCVHVALVLEKIREILQLQSVEHLPVKEEPLLCDGHRIDDLRKQEAVTKRSVGHTGVAPLACVLLLDAQYEMMFLGKSQLRVPAALRHGLRERHGMSTAQVECLLVEGAHAIWVEHHLYVRRYDHDLQTEALHVGDDVADVIRVVHVIIVHVDKHVAKCQFGCHVAELAERKNVFRATVARVEPTVYDLERQHRCFAAFLRLRPVGPNLRRRTRRVHDDQLQVAVRVCLVERVEQGVVVAMRLASLERQDANHGERGKPVAFGRSGPTAASASGQISSFGCRGHISWFGCRGLGRLRCLAKSQLCNAPLRLPCSTVPALKGWPNAQRKIIAGVAPRTEDQEHNAQRQRTHGKAIKTTLATL
mmetsp:Transcript_63612/g.176939  ORF Transcript_63612/g.176939 Transcript_63612/m.176939 type:complete len:537 (-) Transcript_63612:43-1653(-)